MGGKFDLKSDFHNWATSRFEPRLVFEHTQKPDFLISNAH